MLRAALPGRSLEPLLESLLARGIMVEEATRVFPGARLQRID